MRLEFHCPECGQRVRPDPSGLLRFGCKHEGTEKKKPMWADLDHYLIDEVEIIIVREARE